MTPCPWCPYAGCACPWQGGVNPAAAEADTRAKECDNRTNVRLKYGDRTAVSPHLLEQAGDVAELNPLIRSSTWKA